MKSKEFQPDQVVIPNCSKKPLRCKVSLNIREREIEGIALRGKSCGCVKRSGEIRPPSVFELAQIKAVDAKDSLSQFLRKWRLRKDRDVIP